MQAVINKPPGEPAKYSYFNLAEPELTRRVERVLRDLSAATARPSPDAFLSRTLKIVPLETFIPRIRQREVAGLTEELTDFGALERRCASAERNWSVALDSTSFSACLRRSRSAAQSRTVA